MLKCRLAYYTWNNTFLGGFWNHWNPATVDNSEKNKHFVAEALPFNVTPCVEIVWEMNQDRWSERRKMTLLEIPVDSVQYTTDRCGMHDEHVT